MTKDKALDLALEVLELINLEFVCANGSHHAKKDRHEWDEDCPITDRWRKAITALRTAIEQAEKQEPIAIDGNTSDGYHTFNELYEFRKAYNAALFNEWAAGNKCSVHKSWRHHDGELCFGGGWFIVVAVLPDGQISNHYEAKDWDLFAVPETERALFEFDGHTSADVVARLRANTTPPAAPVQEPVKLRRGDVLRCIETDELCTVWATSTTGKTLVKWSANNFGDYTAEQIGELFWIEPAPVQEPDHGDELTIAYMSGVHRGKELAAQRQWVGLTDEEIDDLAEFHGLDFMSYASFTRAIEAKLKEKNESHRQHVTDGSPCWCEPETSYTDPETGASVIVHKEPQ